jgi:membrane protein YdbS with pleckstrin-like domain
MPPEQPTMNPHERRYKRSRRWVVVLFTLWIGTMGLVLLLPRRVQNSESAYVVFAAVVLALFAAMFVVSVINIVAYMRWTGKYPYYFVVKWLRRRSRTQ